MVFDWFRRKVVESDAEQAPSDGVKPPSSETTENAVESSSQAEEEDYLSWAKAAYQNILQQQEQGTATPDITEPSPSTTDATQGSAAYQAPSEAASTEAIPDEATIPGAEVPLEPEGTQGLAETEPQGAEDILEGAGSPAETVEDTVAEPLPIVAETLATPALPEPAAFPAEATPTPEPIAPAALASEPPLPVPVQAELSPEPPAVEAQVPLESEALPFWARAEAERQERLERLKATAIDGTEEIPPTPQYRTPVSPPIAAPRPISPRISPDLNLDEGFLWSAQVLAQQGRRPTEISLEEITWLKRLRQGLEKTRRSLINQLKAIVGQGPLNEAAVMEIETLLLQADVGVEATDWIIEALQNKLREEVLPPEQGIAYLKHLLQEMLDRPLQSTGSPILVPEQGKLNIWLITGVNGAGKTTTIGKIAHIAKKSGYNCLIAAADTFRAAAVEQVKIWGERSGIEVIANPGQNTDPAAVVYDAIAAAQARQTDLLLVDTAGRLQNKKNLMEELSKIRRIIDKRAPNAVIEALLVLDATLGQNGLRQAEVFSSAAKLSGVILTKLDGTAKGGIALAIVQQMGLPIRFIGAGEGIEDLRPFSSYEFIEALLSG